jgi:hypothetical protein
MFAITQAAKKNPTTIKLSHFAKASPKMPKYLKRQPAMTMHKASSIKANAIHSTIEGR